MDCPWTWLDANHLMIVRQDEAALLGPNSLPGLLEVVSVDIDSRVEAPLTGLNDSLASLSKHYPGLRLTGPGWPRHFITGPNTSRDGDWILWDTPV